MNTIGEGNERCDPEHAEWVNTGTALNHSPEQEKHEKK